MKNQAELVQKANDCFRSQQYLDAAQYFEELCDKLPNESRNVWYLGLCYLLQGSEAEAQLTWSLAMTSGDDANAEQLLSELVTILEKEAHIHFLEGHLEKAWLIRRYLIEINPEDLSNLLHFIQISIAQKTFEIEALSEFDIIQLLDSRELSSSIDSTLVLETLRSLLQHSPTHELALEFARACTHQLIGSRELAIALLEHGEYVGRIRRNFSLACNFLELGLQLDPNNLDLLHHLTPLKRGNRQYQEAIEYARRYYGLCESPLDQAKGNAELIAALMSAGGHWQESTQRLELQKQILDTILSEHAGEADPFLGSSFLIKSFFFFPYINDHPSEIRPLQNKTARLFQNNLQSYVKKHNPDYSKNEVVFPHGSELRHSKKLKIGYISRYLYTHSVGWLSRWLFHYHNRDVFDIHVYFVEQEEVSQFTKKWFAQNATQASCFSGNHLGVAEAIYADNIDILVDLDSLTSDCTCSVMALKPAPIQVSWLGLDASGLPAIDYFIADPYVLPENAQSYYSEHIWRLPQTYIAVDGFEVGIPTLRREHLGLPNDAIVYYSVQSGFKRHPDFTYLQLEILKHVPNSYLLVKGVGDQELITEMFQMLADKAGVDFDRFRFLPRDPNELTHRANLRIADVVLDTYPYNGATTTLETLWMEVPLVTRVGQQFSSRNSYTMMVNAGISEGIAWSDEEYLEWGIRFGQEPEFRKIVINKLRRSKQSAPLWNARQFTKEMEGAYSKMQLLK